MPDQKKTKRNFVPLRPPGFDHDLPEPPQPSAPPEASGPPAPPYTAQDIPDDSDHPFGPDPYRYRPNPAAFDISGDRPPVPIPPFAVTGLVEADGRIDIPFEPVPRQRKRRNGWSEEAQRAFISALALTGCVSRAARAVGMSAKSAYRLLDAPGSASFAEAWDQALANGIETLRLAAIDRAMHGAWVAVSRRGKVVRHEHRYNDRMAVALLSGRVTSIADNRERATSRRKHRLFLAARAAEAEERARRQAEVDAAHQAVLDDIEAERLGLKRGQPARRVPRIRSL